jgi:hypothetical protein
MEIFTLRILTIVKILYILRISLIIYFFNHFVSFFGFENKIIGKIWGGVIILRLYFLRKICLIIQKTIISKAKYPLPLNLLCNMIQLGKPYYFGKNKFDLDEIINDNKLP